MLRAGLPLRRAGPAGALALLLAGCGPARWALAHDRPAQACTEAKAHGYGALPLYDDDQTALAETLRQRSTLRLSVRVLGHDEVKARLGREPPADFDQRYLWLETRLEGAPPAGAAAVGVMLSGEGYVFNTAFFDRPESLYSSLGALMDMPAPPRESVSVTGQGKADALNLLGLLGAVTLITPMLSVVTGKDLVTPTLSNEPERHVTTPTEEEFVRWAKEPRVQAAAEVAKHLEAARPEKCAGAPGPCAGEVLVEYERLRGYDKPGPVLQELYLSLHLRLGQGADACETEEMFDLDLAPGATPQAQLARAFSRGAVPLAKLAPSPPGPWSRWWEHLTR